MPFCFYPRHEYACPQVSHCPHLGGAALGTLVMAAEENDQYLQMLHGQLDAERERNSRLFAENEELRRQLAQARLELKVERQRKFAPSVSRDESTPKPSTSASSPEPRKRGAPVGHPGWFRPTPTEYDHLVRVAPPAVCPHCGGEVRTCPTRDPQDHWQEDLVEGRHQVVLYRHTRGRCRVCHAWVQQAGPGELLGSRIGPQMRACAAFLRNKIGISYRKVPQALAELFGFTFVPASLLAFETLLAEKAGPLVDDIARKIGSSDGAVHADETYWSLNGQRAFFWTHATTQYVHFQFDMSRSGQVSRDVLGSNFTGTLVTDCYSGYEAHAAGAKQKCLAHLARTARDWQAVLQAAVPADSAAYRYFEDVKTWVSRGCAFHRQRARGELTPQALAAEEAWLRGELARLASCPLDHDKAQTLQARIQKHLAEWLVFVDDPRVPPTNNLAERTLRPLVVLRKITFGHRTQAGARRLARLMTVQETAQRFGHKASDFFYYLYTHPPDRALRKLYRRPPVPRRATPNNS